MVEMQHAAPGRFFFYAPSVGVLLLYTERAYIASKQMPAECILFSWVPFILFQRENHPSWYTVCMYGWGAKKGRMSNVSEKEHQTDIYLVYFGDSSVEPVCATLRTRSERAGATVFRFGVVPSSRFVSGLVLQLPWVVFPPYTAVMAGTGHNY